MIIKIERPIKVALFFMCFRDYFFAFFVVTSYMIGVAMKIEA